MSAMRLNTYWKTVVDTIQDGVMIVDPGGTIISVNRGFEEITGFKRHEALGKPCTILNCSTCKIVREKVGCHWCLMFERGSLRKQECLLMHKDGRSVHVVKNASILKDENGTVIGAVETMTDISDLVDKEKQIASFRKALSSEERFYRMIGLSSQMQKVFELITNAAQSDAPVIIFGESGTGKELVAKAIHEAGLRSAKPYIKVNCAALNEALLESELFGHVKGAFTGAHRSRKGRFEACHGGDIFLDEIGDLPLSTQVKLLRVLEEKVVERVGDHNPIAVDVRIISATNHNLPELIARGVYRKDFYYRINVIPIHVPPLRDRVEDIPLLARSFFNNIQLKSNKQVQGISNQAMEALVHYNWPGNIRELKSAFEFAFVSCREGMIDIEHLPHSISENLETANTPLKNALDLEDFKRQRLVQALEASGGNQSEAARRLGLSRTSIWNQMKKYNIEKKEYT
jgi:PAS domain S-box-containing protein